MGNRPPCALSIAGSDSGANAGIQADLLSFAHNGVFGTTAITCITSQNPESILSVHPSPATVVKDQIQQVCQYYQPRAAKTGMLYSAEIVEAVLDALKEFPKLKLIVDPVMISSSGKALLKPDAVKRIIEELLPRSTLITPNLDEAEAILGCKIRERSAMREAALELADRCKTAVLIKGGHLEGNILIDCLKVPQEELVEFEQSRIENIDTHGSGCTLSAAITAFIARGYSTLEAVKRGRSYLRLAMQQGIRLNRSSFINHFPQ